MISGPLLYNCWVTWSSRSGLMGPSSFEQVLGEQVYPFRTLAADEALSSGFVPSCPLHAHCPEILHDLNEPCGPACQMR